jgi:hypothetical protein
MKISLIIISMAFISCSSIPEGTRTMSEKINRDKKTLLKNSKQNKEVTRFEQFLTIYAHPQIMNNNILFKKGLYFIPVEKETKGWSLILKGLNK